jgi:hypothetical protein
MREIRGTPTRASERDTALAAGHPPACAASRSPIPNLASLPLHRDAGGIADLNPDAARAGLVGAVDPLRNDALGAQLARMRKNGRAIPGDVFVQEMPASVSRSSRARAALRSRNGRSRRSSPSCSIKSKA